MIALLTDKSEIAAKLRALLEQHGLEARLIRPGTKAALTALYAPDVVAAVVDAESPYLPDHAWHDLLTNLGRRIPVVVLGTPSQDIGPDLGPKHGGTITWLESPTAEAVLSILDACGAIGIDHRKLNRESIPTFNAQVPLHMLQNNGALSVVVIDVSSFRKIAIEYGSDVYHRVQDCFNQLLFDLWGTPGCFRSADILCRRASGSNTYFIFLEIGRAHV